VNVLRRTTDNFFINLVFTEGCLIVTSYKMSDML